jgi:peroxiredoxin
MARRWRWVCSTASILLVAGLSLLVTNGCGKMSSVDSGDVAAVAETDPQFIVPDGKPDEILAFVKELQNRQPQVSTREEAIKHMAKVRRSMISAGDKILATKADDPALKEGATLKLLGTLGQALSQAGISPKTALAVVTKLRNDPRTPVAEAANDYWIPARAMNLKSMSADEKKQLADDAVKLASDAKATPDSLMNVTFLADQLAANGEPDEAGTLYERIADGMASSSDPGTQSYVNNMRGKAARLRLPGRLLEVEGKLLTGEDLDWESYRGKVVLVDYWATWCGPCVAELPNVKTNYDKYHSRGFDVIGISLDRSRKKLETFLQKEGLPWAQLFDDAAEKGSGWQHPMAVRYGVSSIPAAFLVDKTGKVVSTEARGPALEQLLLKLLGPDQN